MHTSAHWMRRGTQSEDDVRRETSLRFLPRPSRASETLLLSVVQNYLQYIVQDVSVERVR